MTDRIFLPMLGDRLGPLGQAQFTAKNMHGTDMTVTEKMVLEINGFFRAVGEAELEVLKQDDQGELEHLRKVMEAYTTRLLEKMPQFRALPVQIIPDLFLQTLKNREAELEGSKRFGQ